MPVSRLRIRTFRNIEAAELAFERVNVLAGENGSGKTSILEAVHVLGSGRSFRTPRPEPLISHAASQFTVHAILSGGVGEVSIGVSRDRNGSFEARLQGRNVSNTAELARSLPILLINSSSFELLDGGPRKRRQFLDWGVFHVEHSFHGIWLEVQRALSQRNALLRHARIPPAQLEVWDAQLADASSRLDELRRRYFETFSPCFLAALHELADVPDVDLAYYRGWDRERDLLEVLEEHRIRDIERGFTGVGPHRADIRVKAGGLGAIDVLSRGQQKLVVCALKVAQGRLFTAQRDQDVVYLVDDLPAELDRRHRIELCRLLGGIRSQIVVSCVEEGDLRDCWSPTALESLRVFHVEQGRPVATPNGTW